MKIYQQSYAVRSEALRNKIEELAKEKWFAVSTLLFQYQMSKKDIDRMLEKERVNLITKLRLENMLGNLDKIIL